MNTYGLHGLPTHELAGMLAPELGEQLATRVSANLADFDLLAERDRGTIARVTRAWGAASRSSSRS